MALKSVEGAKNKTASKTSDKKESNTVAKPAKTPGKSRQTKTVAAPDDKIQKSDKVESVKTESNKVESVKAESNKTESVKTKSGKVEQTSSQPDTKTASDKAPEQAAPVNAIPRFDITLTSERAGYRPPKAAVMAMVQQMAFRGFASPVDEAIAETWSEIYFEPGPSAHEVFIEKEYLSDEPVFHEAVIKFSEKPFFCDYSETPKRPLYWAIEFRGSRFQNPIGSFRKIFLDALNLRMSIATREAQPMEPHKTVPEDEAPVEKKKHERGRGIAGTEVEEV